MKVLDPGHRYMLDELDGGHLPQATIQFVKREGEKFPGNVGTEPGVLLQEVFRACIDRCNYLYNQVPCWQTRFIIMMLRNCIATLENRTRERRNQHLIPDIDGINYAVELEPTCHRCGHIRCLDHK